MALTEYSTVVLLGLVVLLTLLSAYFSSSETAMMALNRYRLRHLVNQQHRAATRVSRLLNRTDRLLGVILIGNNLVNNVAATIAAVIGLKLFGDAGVAAAPFVITLVFLVFAEVAPKTIAAARPERIAFPSSVVLAPLLTLLYPVVVVINGVSNALARPFLKHAAGGAAPDRLNLDELRTVLHEGARIPESRQSMLLGVVDLERVTVDDIMIPRGEIIGIDITADINEIVAQIASAQHTRLPVYRDNINNVIGILHLRRTTKFIAPGTFTKEDLLQQTREPYFVPLGTPLHTQLFNFQKVKRRVALVVDEYGDIQGIVTLEDILEEIVGEFTTDFAATMPEIHPQEDGSYYIDGTAQLRDLNRALGWALPTDGPRTLNGLILEHLEFIPESNVCLRIGPYLIETLQIKDNMVTNVKVQEIAEWRARTQVSRA
jgi:Mg2+/Co2+ transporter CorB